MAQTPPVVDKTAVIKELKSQLAKLDQLQPHINQAVTAFGDQNDMAARATELRNKITAALAAYSA